MKKIILVTFSILLSITLFAQDDESNNNIDLGTDIYSRYVWRGTDFGGSPSIQPFIEASFGDLCIGAWGAYATNYVGAQEADLYLSYTLFDMLDITVTDYFFPDDTAAYNYFDYGKNTGHILEAMVSYNGTDNLPLSATLAYNFYGDNDNSIYAELGWAFKEFDVFCGLTPKAGAYGDDLGVVNLGLSTSKEIEITDKFSLPINASFITNPQAQKVFFVVGISF